MVITFEQLPNAVTQLFHKLENIERLLLLQSNFNTTEQDVPLSINEAAALVHLAVPTIYSLVSQGAIPYSKKGKRLYFSKAELTEWVKSGRKKTNEEIQAEAEAELAALGRRAR